MAYEIIKRLESLDQSGLLNRLAEDVTMRERSKGQKHKAFEESFDAKPIFNESFLFQKLDYIHHNPVSGKWKLAGDFTKYAHSSASVLRGW